MGWNGPAVSSEFFRTRIWSLTKQTALKVANKVAGLTPLIDP
jgi:hypothetical protein